MHEVYIMWGNFFVIVGLFIAAQMHSPTQLHNEVY